MITTDRFVPHVSGIDYGPLDKLVGYAIRRAQLVIYEDFMQALAPILEELGLELDGPPEMGELLQVIQTPQ